MHRLLKRQIKKLLDSEYLEDENILNFLDEISSYYDEKDKERKLLENALEVNSNELTEYAEQLRSMAFYDALTGLTNRKLFEKELELTIKQVQRHHRIIALLFFDLDNFKNVNDTFGHDIGDKLLIKVGELIEGVIRDCDILARWGGDEFVLLLDEISNEKDCTLIVKNIQKAFSEPLDIGGNLLNISFSIGINLYEDGQSAPEMIQNADMAMYLAKEAGKNDFAFYTNDIGNKVLSEIQISRDLSEAINRDEFVLFYQPQIDIKSGELFGAEALLRWEHPANGLVPPNTFIPIAEEKGYIIEIGKIVLLKACQDMKQWVEDGCEFGRVSVNISIKQIRDKNFISIIEEVLKTTGLEAQFLELEVTESVVMKEYEYVVDILQKVRDMGITISIDDFGTGYSSLSHLKKLPISKIKIDKTFIDDIANDGHDIEITKAIIVMSHSLGLSVIAEGVEDKEQLTILGNLNCEMYQGYHYSKPVPKVDFEVILKADKKAKNSKLIFDI